MSKLSLHQHANIKMKNDELNAIYIALEKLLNINMPGYGVFNFSKDLALIKPGESRFRWTLQQCFVGK